MADRPRFIDVAGRLVPKLLVALVLVPTISVRAQNGEEPLRIREQFVPLDQLDAVLPNDRRGVMLPREEFRKLFDRAERNRRAMPNLPAPLLITAATYDAQPTARSLSVTARIAFRQFERGWREFRIPTRGLFVESAQVDGQPARVGRAHGRPDVLFVLNDTPGTHSLQLELSAPLNAAGGDRVAAFGLPNIPSAVLNVAVPAEKRLLVNGLQPDRPATIDKAADYRISVGGQSQVRLRLTEREQTLEADAMVFAGTAYGLRVTPGEVTWQAAASLQVFGRPVSRLRVLVPRTLEIADVESVGLESWELNDADDSAATEITLSWRQAIDKARRIVFRGVMPAPVEEAWSVPNLIIPSVTSHVGRVVVRYPRGTRLRLQSVSGARRTVEQAEPSNVPLDPGDAQLLFDVWHQDYTLQFVTQTKAREIFANLSTILDVTQTGVELETLAGIECLYAPLFEVKLAFSSDWSVTRVTVSDQSIEWPAEWRAEPRAAGVHHIRVGLPKPLHPGQKFNVKLSARYLPDGDADDGQFEFQLPEVRVLQAGVTDGACLVKSAAELEVVPVDIRGLDAARLDVDEPHLGYRYQDTRFSGRILARLRPTRTAVTTLSYTRLDRDALRTWFELQIDVTGGGLRSLKIRLPESTGEDVRFDLAGADSPVRIVEQTSDESVDGRRGWNLRFDRRFRGHMVVRTSVETPRGDEDTFVVHDARVTAADRQSGYVAIEGDSEQQLAVRFAAGAALPPVDPVDLPGSSYVPQQRIVAAYRYVSPDSRIELSETRFDRVAVPTAVCRTIAMTSVLNDAGDFQHQALARIVAVGVQAIRIEFPTGTHLWSTVIDNQPVEVRRTDNTYLVPLPQTEQADAERTIKLIYQTQVPRGKLVDRVVQDPPRLSVTDGSGRDQPLEVLEQSWNIVYPNESMLVASDGRFEPQGNLDQDSVLGSLRDGITPPTWNTLRQHGITVLVIAFGVWLLSMCFRLWKWWGVSLTVALGMLAMFLLQSLSVQRSFVNYKQTGVRSINETLIYPAELRDSKEEDAVSRAEAGLTAEAEFSSARDADGLFNSVPTDERPAPDLPGRTVVGLSSPDEFTAPALEDGIEGQVDQRDIPRGARLSVDVTFQVPAGQPSQQFRYVGTSQAGARSALDVVVQDRSSNSIVRILALLAIAAILWLLRGASLRFRLAAALALVLLPVALVPVIPSSIAGFPTGLLDGIALGALSGAALWLLHGCIDRLKALVREANWKPRTASALVLAVLSAGTTAFADEQQTSSASNPYEASAVDAAAASGVDDQTREFNIVVPYDPDGLPLTAPRVFIPHDRFRRLWSLAFPDQAGTLDADVAGLVAGGVYEARLDREPGAPDRVLVDAKLIVHALRDHQVRVPLPIGDVALSRAQLDGKSATIVPVASDTKDATGGLAVLMHERGAHVLDLSFEIPAARNGPAGRFTLPLRPTAASRLRFVMPEQGLDVSLSGTDTGWRRVVDGDAERIEVAVDRGGDVTLAWQPKTRRGGVNTVVHCEGSTTLFLDDTGLRMQAGFYFRTRQGSLDEVVFALPDNLRVRRIAGPDVAGWEFGGDERARRLTVFLRRPITDQTHLLFDLYRSLDVSNQTVDVAFPDFYPVNVTRETGRLAAGAGEQFSIRSGAISNVRQINPEEFRPVAGLSVPAVAPALAWRYVSRPLGVSVVVARPEPQLIALAEHGVRVEPRRMRTTSRFQLQLKQAPRSRIAVELPRGFLPMGVDATGINDWYLYDEEGQRGLILELDGPRRGVLAVVIEGTAPREPDDDVIEISLPRPLGVDQLESRLAVWLHSIYTATIADSETWRSTPPATLSEQHRKLQTELPQFAMQSKHASPLPVRLDLRRATPILTAESVTIVTVTDASVEYALNLQWHIRKAAVDTFHVTGPGLLAGRVDFEVPGLRRVIESRLPDGRVRWTITLQEPQAGRFYTLGAATLPPPRNDDVVAPRLEFEIQPPGQEPDSLATQTQYIMLVNQSTGQLTADNTELHSSAEPTELPVQVPKSLLDQATEFVRLRDGQSPPVWKLTRFPAQSSAPASVNLADLRSVIVSDGTWRTQVVYTIRNRSRQFLPVVLPSESKLLSVFVRNRPARPVVTERNGTTVNLIALPRTSESDLSYQVRLTLAGTLGDVDPVAGPRPLGEDVALPAPRIVSLKQDAEFGIPVVRTRWTVYVTEIWDASPVDDLNRTNMTLADSGTDEELYVLTAAREADQLFSLFSKAALSSKQLSQATDNLIQLKREMHSYDGTANEVVRQETERFNRRFEELESKISEQEGDQASSETPPRFRNEFSEQQRRRFFEMQNDGLIMGNSAQAIPFANDESGAQATADFNFLLGKRSPADVVTGDGKEAGKDDGRKRVPWETPAGNAALEQRRRSKRGSVEQLELLNRGRAKQMDRTIRGPATNAQRPQSQSAPAAAQMFAPPGPVVDGPGPVGVAGEANQPVQAAGPAAAPRWTGTGGLSLAIDLPEEGHKLVLTRVSGDPKLALRIRPREAGNLASRIAWSAVWVVAVLLLVGAVRRSDSAVITDRLPKFLILAALTILFLLPGQFFAIGISLFLTGTILLGVRYCRTPSAVRLESVSNPQ